MVEPAELDIPAVVAALHREYPDRVAILGAMCHLAEANEALPTGSQQPMFDAEMIRIKLGGLRGTRGGNMAFFVTRGFVVPDDQTNHRYYLMPRLREVSEALDQLTSN
jgi:hypothetical protein